jgi:hypothetical protein
MKIRPTGRQVEHLRDLIEAKALATRDVDLYVTAILDAEEPRPEGSVGIGRDGDGLFIEVTPPEEPCVDA